MSPIVTSLLRAAVAILGGHVERAHRQVCAEVLHWALFLPHWVNTHRRISGAESLEDLAARLGWNSLLLWSTVTSAVRYCAQLSRELCAEVCGGAQDIGAGN